MEGATAGRVGRRARKASVRREWFRTEGMAADDIHIPVLWYGEAGPLGGSFHAAVVQGNPRDVVRFVGNGCCGGFVLLEFWAGLCFFAGSVAGRCGCVALNSAWLVRFKEACFLAARRFDP